MRRYSAINLPASLLLCLLLLTLQPLIRLVSEISPFTAQMPLSFVPNAGQTDEAVHFQVRSLGGTLFFTPGEVVLSLPFSSPQESVVSVGTQRAVSLPSPTFTIDTPRSNDEIPQPVATILRLRFEDANPAAEIIAGEALPGVVNYFLGNDPAQWRTDVPTYAGVAYQDLYAGIDLAYDGTEGLLKGTYMVAAGVTTARSRSR